MQKNGVKQANKLYEHIGKLKQTYPFITRCFGIEMTMLRLTKEVIKTHSFPFEPIFLLEKMDSFSNPPNHHEEKIFSL